MTQNIVHVVGCGAVGEPLIELLTAHRSGLGLDEVTFSKRTPRPDERALVDRLQRRGAILAVAAERRDAFRAVGLSPRMSEEDALARASVVVDCSPAGSRPQAPCTPRRSGTRGSVVLAPDAGCDKLFAHGVNELALAPGDDRSLRVASGNSHAMAALLRSLAFDDGWSRLQNGRFVCMRKSNESRRSLGFVLSPTVERHYDSRFGTRHARDVHDLFETLGHDLAIHSSAVRLPTQYMHAIWFSLELDREISLDEVRARLTDDPLIAVTRKCSSNRVFSFGPSGDRILNQAVVPVDTLTVRDEREVIGMCFSPQESGFLLSSAAAAMWFLDPDAYAQRLEVFKPYMQGEV